MSRVDLIIDGDMSKQVHPHDMVNGDVKLSFDGGKTYPLESARWEHIVIDVSTQPPAEREN